MKKKGFDKMFGEYAVYVKIVIAVILFLWIYPLVKNFVNEIRGKININGSAAVAAGNVVANNPTSSNPSVRLSVLQSYATTIHDAVHGWSNGGPIISTTLKKLLTENEVATLSEYYMRMYSESLLTVSKDQMNKWWATCPKFESLPDYIQNNLS